MIFWLIIFISILAFLFLLLVKNAKRPKSRRTSNAHLVLILLCVGLLVASGSIVIRLMFPVDQQLKSELEKVLIDDFVADTPVEVAIKEAASIRIVEIEDRVITVEVTAPDISDALIAWVDDLPDGEYSDEYLEAEVLELLAGGTLSKTDCELEYSTSGNEKTIKYTSDYSEAISCGLIRFYATMTERVLAETRGDGA